MDTKNREIKFRCWDKKLDKFVHGISIEIDGRIGKPLGRYELQQFTGLIDKNGKEIYEGDILRVISNCKDSKEIIITVEFKEHRTGDFTNFSIWGFRDYSKSTYGATVEVIGNIYENKDLLNK